MIEYQQVFNYLKENGYSEQENISEYWFANCEKCKRIVNQKFPNYSQVFELQVRWRSALGKACVQALKCHIEKLKKQAQLEASERYKLGDFRPTSTRLDLNDFVFQFNNREYTLQSMASAFHTSQIEGWHDLRGIALDGICLTNCILIGLNFSSASFAGASFQYVQLEHCNFVSANFDNSKLVAVIHKETALGGISLQSAFVNAVELNDQVLGSPLRIKEISYFEIVKYLLDSLILKKPSMRNRGKWTRFQLVDVRGINDSLLRYQAEYINWSQSLLAKIDGFHELPVVERASLIASIILTKYWRSATVLASFAVLANLIFTILYLAFPSHFKDFSGTFLESLYFSTLMFTGYGNITPSDDLGRIIVMSEAVIGYLTLGGFLFILGQKVSQRY